MAGLPGSGRQTLALEPFGPADWLIIAFGWGFAVTFGAPCLPQRLRGVHELLVDPDRGADGRGPRGHLARDFFIGQILATWLDTISPQPEPGEVPEPESEQVFSKPFAGRRDRVR